MFFEKYPSKIQCFGTILGLGQLGHQWTFANTPADLNNRMQHGNANSLPPPDMAPITYTRYDNFCGLSSNQDNIWLHSLLARISTASKFFKDSSAYNPKAYHGLPPIMLPVLGISIIQLFRRWMFRKSQSSARKLC